MIKKTCTKCYLDKPLDKFDDCKKKKYGKHDWCKACRAFYYRSRKPKKSLKRISLGNHDLQRDMEKTSYLKPLLSMAW